MVFFRHPGYQFLNWRNLKVTKSSIREAKRKLYRGGLRWWSSGRGQKHLKAHTIGDEEVLPSQGVGYYLARPQLKIDVTF